MPLTPSRFVEPDLALFEQYRSSRDPDARNVLVLRHHWLSRRCASSMSNRGVPLADLVQVAEIGLIKAVERFEPSRQVAFSSFATPTMMGEIRRYFRDMTWSVSVPRRAKEQRGRVQTSTDDLRQILGRSPTVHEVAEQCGLSADAVTETWYANQVYRCSSLEQARIDTGDMIERRASATTQAVDPLAAVELRIEAIRAIADLSERSRKIILWRFYEECTQQEIGDRLGVGQVQVSRLLRAAIDHLRVRLTEPTDFSSVDEFDVFDVFDDVLAPAMST